MTEAEWVVCEDAERMVVVLGHELQYSTRRLPSFAATFAESGRIRALLPPHLQDAWDAFVRWVQEKGPHPSKAPPSAPDPAYWIEAFAIDRRCASGNRWRGWRVTAGRRG